MPGSGGKPVAAGTDGPFHERVVEMSAFVAAPLAGMVLAGLGCDVLRVDPPGGGLDFARWPVTPAGQSIFWAGLNRGKRSVVIDFRRPEGRELVAEIVIAGGQPPVGRASEVGRNGGTGESGADGSAAASRNAGGTRGRGARTAGGQPPGARGGVFLTNLGPGGPLSYEALRRRRPDVISVEVEGYPDGRSAVDYTIAARSGVPFLTGPEGHAGPVNSPLPTWDIATGFSAALAAREAMWRRRQTGVGTRARLALADVAIGALSALGFMDEQRLAAQPRRRDGNYLYGAFGRDFELADGARVMVVAITRKQWRSLVEAVGLSAEVEELGRAMGLDLDREGDRWQARHEIAALVERWCASRSLEEVAPTFEAQGVCWGPYGFAPSLAPGPGARDFGLAARFGEEALCSLAPAPALGQHTEEVLADVLGLSVPEISHLHDRGLVGGPSSVPGATGRRAASGGGHRASGGQRAARGATGPGRGTRG